MKICIINNIYPPFHRGGAEQVVVKTALGLVEKGNKVVIITSSPEGNYVEKHPEFTIYRIHPNNFYFYTKGHDHNFVMRLLWHAVDILNFPLARRVEKILKEEKIDIVHTHNLMGLSFLIPKTIRKLNLKHIHTVHDVQLVEPSGLILKAKENSWRYNGLPTKAYTWLMKNFMGSPEVVISPSQFLLEFYKTRGFFEKSKFVVLRNPLTLEQGIKNEEQKNKLENKNKFNFLYLGQIEEHKGVLLLAQAFKELSALGWELSIVGSGSILPEVKRIVGDNSNIKILGRKNREELPNLFAQTNVTIVPSLCYENSPTVIFESLLLGVPVLASNIEGIAELIQEGENGLTFVAGNKIDLQTKIKWCLEHKEQIKLMSEKAKEGLKGSSPEKYVEKLLDLYGV